MKEIEYRLLVAGAPEFLHPYLEAALRHSALLTLTDGVPPAADADITPPPHAAVYLSSVDVYGAEQGELIGEDTPCRPLTPAGRAALEGERDMAAWCSAHDVPLAILRPAMIVGTGMQGTLRAMVNGIWRGTYRHVRGNDARVSVVHATSVADAVRAVMGRRGVWNVTDNVHPTRHDLAEALAWRLDHKRVYTVTPRQARWLARVGDYLPVTGLTTASLAEQLATLTFDSTSLTADTGFEPVAVTEYLRNHVYDESSL